MINYKSVLMPSIHWFPVMDRMIMKDLLKTIISVLMVLVVIIVSRNFIGILKMAVEGSISNGAILSLLGFKIILASVDFMLPAVFVSVLMVLGRMHRDQEMAGLSSAGVGVGRLYISVFKTIMPVILVASWMAFYVAPWTSFRIDNLLYEQKQNAGVRAISAGNFSEYAQGNFIFYAEEINQQGVMKKVFVQNKQHEKLSVVTSKTAELRDIKGGLYIVFFEGERVQGKAGQMDFIFEYFDEYALRIEDATGERSHGIRSRLSQDLMAELNLHNLREIHRRLSIPLGILVLVIMAVPLAQTQPRGGAYGNMLMAFLVYFSFSNFESVSGSWMLRGEVSIWQGFSGVYILSLMLIGVLLLKLYGLKWVLLTLTGRAS